MNYLLSGVDRVLMNYLLSPVDGVLMNYLLSAVDGVLVLMNYLLSAVVLQQRKSIQNHIDVYISDQAQSLME